MGDAGIMGLLLPPPGSVPLSTKFLAPARRASPCSLGDEQNGRRGNPVPLHEGYFKPALEWIVGIGNTIVLAVFFRVAADQTRSTLISILAFIMNCAVGGYAGIPLGYAMYPLNRVRTSRVWIALLITIPFAMGLAYIGHVMGEEMSATVRAMAKATTH